LKELKKKAMKFSVTIAGLWTQQNRGVLKTKPPFDSNNMSSDTFRKL